MTESKLDPSVWRDFGEAAEYADKASERVNYGKVTITPRYIKWNRDEDGISLGPPDEITPEQYRQLPKEDTSLEVLFGVDIQEFNPALEWTYQKKVLLAPGKNDWTKVVRPSLVKLLGKKIMEDYASAFASLNGKYVQVADVPQVKNPEFDTVEFRAVYASRDECFQSRNERFGGSNSGQATAQATPAATSAVPEGYTDASWKSTIPAIKTALTTQDVNKVASDYMVPPKFIVDVANGVYD
jgi:hypothetical protein